MEHETNMDPGQLHVRRGVHKPGSRARLQPGDQAEILEDFEDWLLCTTCQHRITRDRDRMALDGQHQHAFFNPAGILYEIGLFQEAAGCQIQGPATEEFSWFPGYAWRYALCGACACHLGWWFERGEMGFFGLVRDRMVGESNPESSPGS